jgi:16S rRNA (guanine527-N7)-methyltransferase
MPRELDPELLSPDHYPRLSFPDEAWSWFEHACADIELPVYDTHRDRLEAVYSHLLGVNEWMNLTRITEPLDFLKFHVFDSLTALPVIEDLTEAGDVCVDLGSGGGYPGLPLAIWLPDRRWLLVDSRSKKVAFLKQALTLTPCSSARALAFRGREVRTAAPEFAGRAAVVVARAVGRADKLLPEAVDLLQDGGLLLILKGPSFEASEQRDFVNACPAFGFELVQEMRLALDPDDPERILVLAAKTDTPKDKKRRRKSRRY